MGGARDVWGEKRNPCRAFMGNTEGNNHLEDLGKDGRMIFEYILKKSDWRTLTGLIWLTL